MMNPKESGRYRMKGVHYQGILDQDQIGEQLVSFFDTFRGRFLSSNTVLLSSLNLCIKLSLQLIRLF